MDLLIGKYESSFFFFRNYKKAWEQFLLKHLKQDQFHVLNTYHLSWDDHTPSQTDNGQLFIVVQFIDDYVRFIL